jgi:hypothetical protein
MRLLPTLALLAALAGTAHAQYTKSAGQNAPTAAVESTVVDDKGVARKKTVQMKVASDQYGNAAGNQHDLAVDGAFEGQTVAVIQLYTGENFDFKVVKEALLQKGFSVFRWSNGVPTPEELEKKLEKASQLWVIASDRRHLTDEHVKVIRKFWESGKGLYIWGDNDPYYVDANVLGKALFDTTMEGNLMGDKPVGLQSAPGKPGLLRGHLLTTGLEHIYEGITIATIQPGNQDLKPLIYGSAGNLVSAYYDKNQRRAIFDGGFTRLYMKWDTAGTARYVKNAASWLVNAERFGDQVVAAPFKKQQIATPKKPTQPPAKP